MPGCLKSKDPPDLAGLFLFQGFGGVCFLCNNGLREAVVTRVVFVFEHFFYSGATCIL
jgi:hypothetical protein